MKPRNIHEFCHARRRSCNRTTTIEHPLDCFHEMATTIYKGAILFQTHIIIYDEEKQMFA